ncbi:F-box domain [Ceraceosorus bombacis]|uniref:F-box domain n=1 Tax=Ceraceosorus bombacis TaxID=401625 RepID=A0A0N7L9V0_9BASI|nr:F-box domain [Ceraceosorus bombacis]
MRTQFLPTDLFFVVLEQLDLATALQSRGVNREWKSTIDAHCLTWKRYAVHLRLINKIGSSLPYEKGYKAVDENVTRNVSEASTSLAGFFKYCTSFRQLCALYIELTRSWATGYQERHRDFEWYFKAPCKVWSRGTLYKIEGVWSGPEAMSFDHLLAAGNLVIPFWLGDSTETGERMIVDADLIRGRRLERAVRVQLEAKTGCEIARGGHTGRSWWWNLKFSDVVSEEKFCCLLCLLGLRKTERTFRSLEPSESHTFRSRTRDLGRLKYGDPYRTLEHAWDGGWLAFSPGRGLSDEALRSLDSADLTVCDRLYFLAWPSDLRVYLRSDDDGIEDDFPEPEYHFAVPSERRLPSNPDAPDPTFAIQSCTVARIPPGRACVNAKTVVTWNPRSSTPVSKELLPTSVETILKEDSTKFGKIESVAADIRTKTLVIAFDWGLLLFRPFTALIGSEKAVSVGVVIHFRGEKKKGYESKCRGLAVYDGRICHSIEHRDADTPKDELVKNTIFVIDLDPSRLNPTVDPTELPIDSCRIRVLREENVYPVALNHSFEFVGTDIEMDATGIYMREPTHLNYIDFGLAVNHPDTMRPDPTAALDGHSFPDQPPT